MNHRFNYLRLAVAILVSPLCVRASNGAVVAGHVEAWGGQLYGETIPPSGLEGVIAVAGGFTHSLALTTNGTVVAWGSADNGESPISVPAGLTNIVSIAAGGSSSAAVKADGTVVIWGPYSWLTNVPPEAVGIKTVKVVGNAIVALRTNGTVIAWGVGSETAVPPGLSNVIQIAGVNGHVLALRQNGTIVGWGGNSDGQASHPAGLQNVVKVAAGQEVSMALSADGTLFRWGSPFADPGEPPPLSNVIDIDLGNAHAVALRADGTVAAWGSDFRGQSTVPPLLNGVTAISAGGNHNLVITARPVISSITPRVSTPAGSDLTLTVVATGEPLSYQWQHKGTNVPGATGASLAIRRIDAARTGSYAVYVTNPHGYNYAATSVALPPPNITGQPESRTVYRGEVAMLRVMVSGFSPFSYQWFRDGTIMPNETNATIVVPTNSSEDSSVFRVTIVDAAGGTVTSSDAAITVFDPRWDSLMLGASLDTSIFSTGVNPLGTATLLSGTRANGIRDRGLLRFDLSSIPTNAVLESVSLRLRLVKAPRSPTESSFSLHRALKPWEGDATWANASSILPWSAPGGAEHIDYSANGIRGTFMNADLVFGRTNEMFADVGAWIQNPATNHGWFLICDQEASLATARHFGSSESQTPPELTIRYAVPAEIPNILGVKRVSTNLVFSINPVPGWFYDIQTRQKIDRGNWTTFTNAAAGAGLSPIVISAPLTNSHQFFRALRH